MQAFGPHPGPSPSCPTSPSTEAAPPAFEPGCPASWTALWRRRGKGGGAWLPRLLERKRERGKRERERERRGKERERASLDGGSLPLPKEQRVRLGRMDCSRGSAGLLHRLGREGEWKRPQEREKEERSNGGGGSLAIYAWGSSPFGGGGGVTSGRKGRSRYANASAKRFFCFPKKFEAEHPWPNFKKR